MDYSNKHRFTLEMGFSKQEFISLLQSQNKLPYQFSADKIQFDFAGAKAVLTLGQEGVRKIASARIPKLIVDFDLTALEGAQRNEFMKQFFSRFHRGGG